MKQLYYLNLGKMNLNENPNVNPLKYLRISDNDEKMSTKTVLLFDVSGSQSDYKDGYTLIKQVSKVSNNERNITVLPFGYSYYTHYHPLSRHQKNPYCRENNCVELIEMEKFKIYLNLYGFNTCTYTNIIEYFFSNLIPTNEPLHLLLQGDGAFSRGCTTLPEILKKYRNKLLNLKSFTLIFSPHTENRDMLSLNNDTSAILEECNSYVEFNTIKLTDNENELNDIINKLSSESNIVSSEYLSYRKFVIHHDLIPSKIAEVFVKNFPDTISQIIKDMMKIVKHNPNLFLSERNIYSKLYSVLICLKNFTVPMRCLKIKLEEFIQQELTKAMTIQDTKQTIKNVRLIDLIKKCPEIPQDTFINWVNNLDDEFSQLKFKLISMSFDYGTVQTEFIDWLSQYKQSLNKSSSQWIALEKLFNDIRTDPATLKWAQYQLQCKQIGYIAIDSIFVENNKEKIILAVKDGSGVLLSNLTKCLMRNVFYTEAKNNVDGTVIIPDANICSSYDARTALGQLFCQFGVSLIGNKLYIVLLTIIVEDIEVNSELRKLSEKAVFDDEEYTNRNIYKSESKTDINTVDTIDNIWFSPEMARILFRSITLYGERMFPKTHTDPKFSLILNQLKVLYLLPRLTKRVAITAQNSFITRNFTTVVNENDDNCNKKINVGDIVCVYDRSDFDNLRNLPATGVVLRQRPLNTGIFRGEVKISWLDEDRHRKINVKSVSLLKSNPKYEDINYLRILHYQWRDDDEKGIPASLDERYKIINERLKINNKTKIITMNIIVPSSIVYQVLNLSTELQHFIKSGERISRDGTSKFFGKNFLSTDKQVIDNFNYNYYDIKLTEDEISKIIKLFEDSNKEIINGSRENKLASCYLCLEDIPHKNAWRFPCGHTCCYECNPKPVYDRASFIDLSRHYCPYCPGIWLHRDTDEKTFGDFNISDFNRTQTWRFCSHCNVPFGTSLNCGATLENVSHFCDKHRENNILKSCPSCGVSTIRIDGCNHIECTCGEHWCWLDGKGGFYDDHHDIGNNNLPGIYKYMHDKYGGYFTN